AAASQLLGADLGKTMLYGLVLGIPMAIAGGIVYGGWIGRRIFVDPPRNLMPVDAVSKSADHRKPSFASVITVILLPVTLIALGVLSPLIFAPDAKFTMWAKFAGTPSIALLCGTGFAY